MHCIVRPYRSARPCRYTCFSLPIFDVPYSAIGISSSCGQPAGHRFGPQQFVAKLRIDEPMQRVELRDDMLGIGFGRRDEFEQRLGVVGRQRRMRQRRSERPRMRSHRQCAVARARAGSLFRCRAGRGRARPVRPARLKVPSGARIRPTKRVFGYLTRGPFEVQRGVRAVPDAIIF